MRFSKIRELVFQECWLKGMEENALIHFPKLDTLNVACDYRLGMRNVLQAISKIPGKPVETLVLDDIDRTVGNYRYFDKSTVCISDFPNLKRLSIRNNAIDSISFDILSCIPSLEVLNIGFNALSVTFDLWKLVHTSTMGYWMNSNLTELDLSYGYTTYQYNFRLLYCPDNLLPTSAYFRNAEIPSKYTLKEIQPRHHNPSIIDNFFHIRVNPKLQAIHADHMHITFHPDLSFARELLYSPLCQLNLQQKNDIRFINVSYNQLGDFYCHLNRLDHLQVLDMSYNNIKIFNKENLRTSPNLRVMYLTGNQLGQNYSEWETLFHFVPVLEFLSISDNKLKRLPTTTFSKMKDIKDIDLSKNSLSEFNMELKGVPELERLDLSYNLLPSLQRSISTRTGT